MATDKKKAFKPNGIIRSLMITDALVWTGAFFNSAIAAVYLAQVIPENSVQIIAIGYAVYLMSRSLPQFLIAKILDHNKSYLDETYLAMFGTIIWGISYALFIFISKPWHLYTISILNGIGVAMYLPAWRKMFAKYLDKGQEAKENAFLDSIESAIGAGATILGAEIVTILGTFKPVFIAFGAMAVMASFFIAGLTKYQEIKDGKAFSKTKSSSK